MQIAPSPSLQNIVRHYLILSSNACNNPDFRIFSDGSPGIVFHRKTPFIQVTDKNGYFEVQPNCFVYGQITQFNTLSATAEMDMLIVVLQPSALLKLFNIAAFEINNKTISLVDLTGHSGRSLIEKVHEQPENTTAISLIEEFLFNRAIKKSDNDEIVSISIKQIYAQKGMTSLTKMFKEIPVTERQLERKFREHIGLSPKKFAGIIKLQYFLKCLKTSNNTKNISEISYHCGYYDQSQLNNIFKKNTGLTPLQYQANANLLAINFLLIGS